MFHGRHSISARIAYWIDRLDKQARELQKQPHSVTVTFTSKRTLEEYNQFLGDLRWRLLNGGDLGEFARLRPLIKNAGDMCQKLEIELDALTDPDLTQFVDMTDWEHTRMFKLPDHLRLSI
jgi:hypothetical protein